MEALKESVKHTQEVGEGISKRLEKVFEDIFDLAQIMILSIEVSQQNMMLAFQKMLEGVGYALALQSPFNQGQYPLVFGFKSPSNHRKALMAHLVHETLPTQKPPPSLSRVPTPLFARPERNSTQPAELVLSSIDVSNPIIAQE
jgi:hypothetical protein